MKRLKKPQKNVADILLILRGEASRNDDILDIESVIDPLKRKETLYSEKVEDNTLFEIPKERSVSIRVDRDKMVNYYEYRLLKKPNGRSFYDEMILSAPYGICPYCTIRTVKTLDHFLPKSDYPAYAITPVNLVPSCRDCNTDKKVSTPTCSDDQTFHPYFDIVDNECWIKAILQNTEPLSLQYSVIKPDGWDDNKLNRAYAHFKGYDISQLFSNEANRELRGMQKQCKELFSRGGNLLKDHLQETYESCLDGLGLLDWKTLMYKELSTNDWFLNGCTGVNYFN